jgi:hypothetical protein
MNIFPGTKRVYHMEVMLNASIKRHSGARSFKDGFNVMNDVIVFANTQEMRIDAEAEDWKQAMKIVLLGGM